MILRNSGSRVAPLWRACFLFCGLFVLATFFYSKTALAEPSWCVRELDRTDDNIVVQHNPECDLRILPRMYPQKDESGKVLPMQVQLRSLFAANQTRTVDGVKYRFTVMRGCVSPGKPSLDADAEELALCPNGLMNYFSAPSGDSAARIVVPVKRKLTIAEQNLELAKIACTQLQEKPLVSDADKKAADACSKQFTEMVFGASAVTPSDDASDAGGKEPETIKKPEEAKSAPVAENSEVTHADGTSQLSIALFILLISLAFYGAAVTVLVIITKRNNAALTNANQRLLAERSNLKEILQKEVAENNKLNLQSQRERIVKEQKDTWHNTLNRQQRELNQLTSDNAKLKKRNEELGNQIEDYRESVLPVTDVASVRPVSSDTEQLKIIDAQRAEIRKLKNDSAGKVQQVTELRGEMKALADRNVQIESEATQSHGEAREAKREKVALEMKVSELDEENASLRNRNNMLLDSVQEKDGQIKELQVQGASSAESIEVLEQQKNALQVRVEQLLQAANLCGMRTGTGHCRDSERTLPFGIRADKLAQDAEDANTNNVASDTSGLDSATGSEERDKNYPDNWREVTVNEPIEVVEKRAHDSVRPQPMEDGVFEPSNALAPPRIPLDMDPEEEPYRQEMPTMEREIPVEAIAQEQMFHYRRAWKTLARDFASVLDPSLQVDDHSNAESVNNGLGEKLHVLLRESAEASSRLEELRQEYKVVDDTLDETKSKLRTTTAQMNVAIRSLNEWRKRFDVLAVDLKGDKAKEKLYAYQLSAVKAEERAIRAEIAERDLKDDLLQVNAEISDAKHAIMDLEKENSLLRDVNEQLEVRIQAFDKKDVMSWRTEPKTDSGLAPDPNKATDLSESLKLGEENWVLARDVLVQLPDDELLRLANSVFHALAHKMNAGVNLDYPLASNADLVALRSVVMMPLVSDFPYVMPDALLNMAKHGAPKVYSVLHDALKDLQSPNDVPPHKSVIETMMPPAGVPEERNSASPHDLDQSQVKPRAALCLPSGASDDESHTA